MRVHVVGVDPGSAKQWAVHARVVEQTDTLRGVHHVAQLVDDQHTEKCRF